MAEWSRLRGAAALVPVILVVLSAVPAAAGYWALVSSSFTGDGPGGLVLPGGGASLSVGLSYQGPSDASNVTVCVTGLPGVFSLAPGSEVCVPRGGVAPGGAVSASWSLLVSRSASPGTYSVEITVYYSVNGSPGSETFTVEARVSEPPAPAVRVLEAYWGSGGYPGSTGDLVLVLVNDGPGDVAGGFMRARLSGPFSPSVVEASVPALPEGGVAEVVLRGVSVGEAASPGVYRGSFDAVLSVSSGPGYTANVSGVFSFQVSAAPREVLRLVDYGVSQAASGGPPGAGESIYLLLRVSRPGAVVRHVYAEAVLSGARAGDGSDRAVATVTGAYDYGDPVTIVFGPLFIDRGVVEARVSLLIHVEEDGREYWVRQSYLLRVNASLPGPLLLAELRWAEARVYPGSEATVEAVLVNRGPSALLVQDAVLETPWGSGGHEGPVELPPGGSAVLRFSVPVPRDVEPGDYVFSLHVSATSVAGGAAGAAAYTFRGVLRVEAAPGPGLELVEAGWSWGGPACPLTRGAEAWALLRISDPGAELVSIHAWLEPGPGALVEGPGEAARVETGYGGLVELRFTGLGYAGGGDAAVYVLHVEALVRSGGGEYWANASFPLTLPVYTGPGLRLAAAWLEPGLGAGGYPVLAAELQWLYPYASASRVEARLLEAPGAEPLPGSGRASEAVSLGYGASTVLRLGPLRLQGGELQGRLWLAGYAALPGGGWCGFSLEEDVDARQAPVALRLLGVETLYSGSPVPLLPGSWGVVLRLRLHNPLPVGVGGGNRTPPPGWSCRGGLFPCWGCPPPPSPVLHSPPPPQPAWSCRQGLSCSAPGAAAPRPEGSAAWSWAWPSLPTLRRGSTRPGSRSWSLLGAVAVSQRQWLCSTYRWPSPIPGCSRRGWWWPPSTGAAPAPRLPPPTPGPG